MHCFLKRPIRMLENCIQCIRLRLVLSFTTLLILLTSYQLLMNVSVFNNVYNYADEPDMSLWRKLRGLSLKESLDFSKLFQNDYDNLQPYPSLTNTSQTSVSTITHSNSSVKFDILNIDYKSTSINEHQVTKMPTYSSSQSFKTTAKTTVEPTTIKTTADTTLRTTAKSAINKTKANTTIRTTANTTLRTTAKSAINKTKANTTTTTTLQETLKTSKTIPLNVSQNVNVSKEVITNSDINANKSTDITSQSNSIDVKLENYGSTNLNNSLPLLNITELSGDIILYENTTTSTSTESLENMSVINSSFLVPSNVNYSSESKCREIPSGLKGRIKVSLKAVEIKNVIKDNPQVQIGGFYKPEICKPNNTVAIVIPFKNRDEQLYIFLKHMHPFLQRQEIQYRIYVINQVGTAPFNRAKLLNIGFTESQKDFPWNCTIFHDVDLLPEDDRNLYVCESKPKHMSVAVNTFKYKLPYNSLFGGVTAFSTQHFRLVNGYSNEYWGWGAEDDDMFRRIKFHSLGITRPKKDVARYTMIRHKKEQANKDRNKILKLSKRRFATDGLINLKYDLISVETEALYTNVSVSLTMPKKSRGKRNVSSEDYILRGSLSAYNISANKIWL